MLYLAVYLIMWAIIGSIFGVATNAIIKNRGYSENWFWWGFFFGFIAMIVALSKPAITPSTHMAIQILLPHHILIRTS